MSKYLVFSQREVPGRKTDVVDVYSQRSGTLLAEIKWYGSWRQYAFFPVPGTIWNPDCLNDINHCIANLMEERKIARAS